ncbi:MAG: hypothetical protein Q3972_09045 [Corynebacterium sp.]|nr:hypothetical protein [Corynebacterium sp.]
MTQDNTPTPVHTVAMRGGLITLLFGAVAAAVGGLYGIHGLGVAAAILLSIGVGLLCSGGLAWLIRDTSRISMKATILIAFIMPALITYATYNAFTL